MLTNKAQRGADALVDAMKRSGVRRVFTLSGNHIMPVFDALLGSGIELVHTRDEAAAVHMADACARLTGEPGVALVTGGPGHANAVPALYTARMAESPVVLLSGHAPAAQLGMGAFQEMRQADLASPASKAAWTARDAGSLASDFALAVRTALGGRAGPVNLNLPSDALEASLPITPSSLEFVAQPRPLAAAEASIAMERLGRARRPLILAGPASLTRSGRKRLAALEEASRIPAIGMESPRGTSDPSLGAFAEMLGQSDCVLLVGKRLDFTLRFGAALAADCRLLQIDAEAEEIERSRRAVRERLEWSALADLFPALEALAAEARAGSHHWLDEVRAALAYRPAAWQSARASRAERLHPVELARPLQAVLDSHPDAVLIADGGEIGQWAQACLSAPQRVINGVAGSIGAALPFALGARFVERDAPVIAVMGDGTFGFHLAELDTAVTHGLAFLAVIGNDARWNAEHQIQLREYGEQRAHGCVMREQRYDRIAQAFGAWGERVTEAGAMPEAVMRALGSRLPACLEVMIEGLPAPQIARPPVR
jgi:acetolactate synthase-1/2/3 large subunit